MTKILLVEDVERYRKAAEECLSSNIDTIISARDYSEAINQLNLHGSGLDAVVTDCFFPELTGSGKRDLGKELVGKMAKSDPHERRIVEGLGAIGQYVNLEDSDMRKYARFLIGISQGDISKNMIFRSIERVGMLGKAAATHIAKNSLGLIYREKGITPDHYGALTSAIELSEANQPLGLLVAEKAEKLGLPLVLATSTYHHDILTQPIQDYASRNGWALIDCGQNREDDKASPQFWGSVYASLSRKMGDRR